MQNHNFTTTFLVDQTTKEVFNAINNVRRWWSEEIEGNTDKINAEFIYHYKDVHYCKMKLIELIPEKKVVWLVLDNSFNFTKDKSEWKDTKISFEISKKGKQTQIHFTHIGLVPEYECHDICTEAWGNYINNSLRSLITSGKGQPNTKEDDGFNAWLVEKNLNNQSFSTTFLVDQTPKEVFDAINNVRGWWTGEPGIEGSTEKPGDEFTYRYQNIHYSKQKVTELIPGKIVVWFVLESSINFVENKAEWKGTKIIFEIAKKGDKTEVRFTHAGLVPEIECYNACSNAWNSYINDSLRNLIITTGNGQPDTKGR